MMTEPPIGELLEKVDCRYTLAVEASKRAREIISGSLPLIDTKETKPLSIETQRRQQRNPNKVSPVVLCRPRSVWKERDGYDAQRQAYRAGRDRRHRGL